MEGNHNDNIYMRGENNLFSIKINSRKGRESTRKPYRCQDTGVCTQYQKQQQKRKSLSLSIYIYVHTYIPTDRKHDPNKTTRYCKSHTTEPVK